MKPFRSAGVLAFLWTLVTGEALIGRYGQDFCAGLNLVVCFGVAYDIVGSFGIAYFRFLFDQGLSSSSRPFGLCGGKPVFKTTQLEVIKGARVLV